MGFMSDHQVAEYKGNTVEIDTTAGLLNADTSLIINGKRVDSTKIPPIGVATLRGTIDIEDVKQIPVRVNIKQGLGTKYTLEVDGVLVQLRKLK